MKISLYTDKDKSAWDEFVTQSKNGVFLFYRDYLEYHKDRFTDYSLIVKNVKEEIIALFPANCDRELIISHQGLSFGGVIIDSSIKISTMLEVFDSLLTYLKENGFNEVIYKTIPTIYHAFPSEEDRYSLFVANANLRARSIFTVVEPKNQLPMQERRMRGIKKAQKGGITVLQSNRLSEYWSLLQTLLAEQHKTMPVHTLEEMTRLMTLFPEYIKLYASFKDDQMLAGVLVYENRQVARAQYIAANDLGKKLGALDLLFYSLINEIYHDKKYFDFSNSDTCQGKKLNTGLIEQKEGFGGRSVSFDQYAINLQTWQKGDCLKVLA